MTSMIKSLKDFKRRSIQTVLETVGKTDRTEDNDFDTHVTKFQSMIQDMNECGAALHSYLSNQKVMFTDARDMAASLSRIYQLNASFTNEDWPNTLCEMHCNTQAKNFGRQWADLNDVVRSSSAAVCAEQALDRLKFSVTKMEPEIQAGVKDRHNTQKDYDYHRGKLKALELKKEAYEKDGKSDSKAALENAEELEKFQKKVESGLENYNRHNEKTKSDIIAAKKNHDQLMDHVLVTVLVCQAELFARTAEKLEGIIATLPDQRVVQQIRQRVQDFEKQGGVKAEKPAAASKGFPSIIPKSVPFASTSTTTTTAAAAATPPIQRNSNTSAASRPSAPPPPSAPPSKTNSVSNPFEESGNPFEDDSSPPRALQVPASNPFGESNDFTEVDISKPSKSSLVMVKALFNHEAEEDDELNFFEGDLVEVLEKADGGWWKGRCHGKEGLFPSNYVQPHTD